MRILLITDTHGKIDRINEFAAEYRADACIHCGDFGFFDAASIRNLRSAELQKMIRHCNRIMEKEKALLCASSQEIQAEFILQNRIAGTFDDYLTKKKSFCIPVYAVWGNHEDVRVIEQLRKDPLHNLTLLDEKTTVMLEDIRLYGCGGDFNEKYLPLAKKLGIPWIRNQIKSAFWQYRELMDTLAQYPPGEKRIQITHADPHECPFLETLAYRSGASLTLSGHMHRQESLQWETTDFSGLQETFPDLAAPEHTVSSIRHLNLPPAKPVILEITGSNWKLEIEK
ncbi:MAG: metallophosphoesterase [Lentisphaeria bacterium]|nr:metallophosphoesterase [Lentisphaeria bacterium]